MRLISNFKYINNLYDANNILLDWYNDRNIKEKRKDYESKFLYSIMCFEDRDTISKWFAPLNVYCRLIDRHKINDDDAWEFVTSKYNKCIEDLILNDEELI
jgi:hypothetical protein